MAEQATPRRHRGIRAAVRYAAELVIFAVGITTVTAGAAGFSDAGETRDGTPVAAATCVTPTADEARQTPLRHNPYVL